MIFTIWLLIGIITAIFTLIHVRNEQEYLTLNDIITLSLWSFMGPIYTFIIFCYFIGSSRGKFFIKKDK